MPLRDCLEINSARIVGEYAEGSVVKVETLSFLGDVDKSTGAIVSEDSGAKGVYICNKVLVVKRFRGSTVGTYVMYSLCRRGLAPRAIVTTRPDPVVIAGAVLCGITFVYNVPEDIVNAVEDGSYVKIEKMEKGVRLCIY